MSVKRQATTQLTHDNWDQDDPDEHEEMGSFKSASKEVLEKRVIKTAKRRSAASSETKSGVFTGFGGFNKTQPSSFDFLSNLTNVNQNANGSPNKSDTSVTSSLFSKPTATSPGGSLFGTQESTTPPKVVFGIPNPVSPISGGTGATLGTSSVSSGFTASKADSTVGDSPFKIQPVVSSSADTSRNDFSKTTNANSSASTSHVTSTIFGIPPTNSNKPLLSTTINSSPFKIPTIAATSVVQSNATTLSMSKTANTKSMDNNVMEKIDDKKVKYYTKLKGLNQSVSNWIKKHVEETPVCILSPIFKDYEKHLKVIQDEYQVTDKAEINKNEEKTMMLPPTGIPPIHNKTGNKSSSIETTLNKPSLFGLSNNVAPENKPKFSFGIKTTPVTSVPTTAITGTGFTSPTNTTQPMSASAPSFSMPANTTTTSSNGIATFSFGTGKPFSFNSHVQANADKPNNENEEEDGPPKVEFTPIVEENSVYEKRCKIFVKKDGNFADKGVGTLYIKKIEESGKHQLLVRANTSLGNIMINLMLVSAVPTQRTGKNNVMMVCIPTPDSKPPPTPVLIRVKTSEEADELLETLNKYKT